MRLPAALRPVRTLATRTIVHRGALLCALALAERLLAPATAWVVFGRPLRVKLAVGMALGIVFTVRAFLVRSFAARTEADLMDRVIGSVLHGDVLRPSILPGEDAHAELGQGVYMTALQFTEGLPALTADIVATVLLTVVIVSVEPLQLVLVATALMVSAGLGLMWSRGRLQRAAQTAWSLHERLQDLMVDALEGRLDIVASGEREAFADRAHERAHAWGVAGVRMARSSLVTGRLPPLAIAFAVAIVVTLDSHLRGAFPASLADVALLASVTPAFAGVGQGILNLVQTAPWMRAAAQVVEGARPKHGGAVAGIAPARVAFEAVSFRYEGADTDALSGIDFVWEDESVIALLGANGSGKSTWLRLLLALGAPRAGRICVGDIDLAAMDADLWRNRIAFLPQRPYLPNRADVGATVRLVAPLASDARIMSCLERVGMLEALRCAGTDPLAVRVDTLSVGQRQRVALARMLCRDASIFVLDEPDANLDRAGIALVAELVRSLSRDHKVLMAAHTAELVAVADRVIELDHGRVVRDVRRRQEEILALHRHGG